MLAFTSLVFATLAASSALAAPVRSSYGGVDIPPNGSSIAFRRSGPVDFTTVTPGSTVRPVSFIPINALTGQAEKRSFSAIDHVVGSIAQDLLGNRPSKREPVAPGHPVSFIPINALNGQKERRSFDAINHIVGSIAQDLLGNRPSKRNVNGEGPHHIILPKDVTNEGPHRIILPREPLVRPVSFIPVNALNGEAISKRLVPFGANPAEGGHGPVVVKPLTA